MFTVKQSEWIWQDCYFESLPDCQYHVHALVVITRIVVGMLFGIQVCQNESVSTPLGRRACIHPVGFSGATPRRKDKRAKEGPRLTALGNDSLQTLCRVTSANHNNPFKPPGKRDTKNRAAAFFFCSIMRPRDKHLHGDEQRRRGSLKFSFVSCRWINKMSLFH